MAFQYRRRTRTISGTVTTIQIAASPEKLREWVAIECDLGVGVPLLVTITDRLDSSVYINFELQPGEKIVFSEKGDMPWDGAIYVTTGTTGVTSAYRGGEVYWERIG